MHAWIVIYVRERVRKGKRWKEGRRREEGGRKRKKKKRKGREGKKRKGKKKGGVMYFQSGRGENKISTSKIISPFHIQKHQARNVTQDRKVPIRAHPYAIKSNLSKTQTGQNHPAQKERTNERKKVGSHPFKPAQTSKRTSHTLEPQYTNPSAPCPPPPQPRSSNSNRWP